MMVGGGCAKTETPPPVSTAVVPSGYETKAVKYYHFSISYPAGWETKSDGQNATAIEIFSPYTDDADTFRENLNVIETGLRTKISLADYFEGGRTKNKAMSGYQEISSTDIVVDGYPGKRLEFEVPYPLENQEVVNLHMVQYAALTPERAYTITCTLTKETAPEYVKQCDAMVGSLKLQTEAVK